MKPKQPQMSVHVDVMVNGERVPSVTPVKTVKRLDARLNPQPYSIVAPTPGCDLLVIQIGGAYFIEAAGGSLVSNGAYPTTVHAIVYPNVTVNPVNNPQYDEPDPNAVSCVPNNIGVWSFASVGSEAANPGPVVPGVVPDNVAHGASNNTLMIWYEYDFDFIVDGGFIEVQEYTVEIVRFHAYTTGGSQPVIIEMPAHLPATTLVAEFHAALHPLGKIHLKWNGVSWAGESGAHGGVVLSLTRVDQVYQLSAAGPAAAFIVAGPARSARPFHWQGEGKAVGNVAGSFKVTITE